MRRRDLLAGIGSAGVLAGGGAIAVFGIPSLDPSDGDGETNRGAPVELETADAPGSEVGSIVVPDPNLVTFVDFFATWCTPCKRQMPALAEANSRIGVSDDVQFASITSERVGPDGQLTEAELAEWWDEHGGEWTIGLDPMAELEVRYEGTPYPKAVVIDTNGRVVWSHQGVTDADTIVEGIETGLDRVA